MGWAATHRHAHGGDAGADPHHQFLGLLVGEPDRAALGLEHGLRRVDHLGQHRVEVERRRELARDVEDARERQEREAAFAHRASAIKRRRDGAA